MDEVVPLQKHHVLGELKQISLKINFISKCYAGDRSTKSGGGERKEESREREKKGGGEIGRKEGVREGTRK